MIKITHLTNISSKTPNTISFNKWHDFYFKLESQLLSDKLINHSLTLLWDKLKCELENKDPLILIQFKIKIDNNNNRSISFLQTVKFDELDDLIDIFTEFWNLRDEDYTSLSPSHIIYTYKIVKSPSGEEGTGSIQTSKFNRDESINTSPSIKFKGFNLPCTMDFSK